MRYFNLKIHQNTFFSAGPRSVRSSEKKENEQEKRTEGRGQERGKGVGEIMSLSRYRNHGYVTALRR